MRLSSRDFDEAVATHRHELLAHCYRMLGSPHDAEDALQEALVGAWKGWGGFEGRSSVRTWLFRIATNACLKQAQRRPSRVLSADLGPGFTQTADLGRPDTEHLFLEPWADEPDDAGDPEAAYTRRESVELAYVAALQHLAQQQDRALGGREVLERRDVGKLDAFSPRVRRLGVERVVGLVGPRLEEEVLGVGAAQVGGLGEAGAEVGAEDPGRPALRLPDAGVGGDPEQPGPHRAPTLEPRPALPGADQGLLQRVLGVVRGAEHPVAMSQQLAAMVGVVAGSSVKVTR